MNSVQLPEATIIYCFIISNVLVYDPKTFEETSQPKPKQGMVWYVCTCHCFCIVMSIAHS